MFTIGQFAKLAGVTIRTLRYYDQKGLLKPGGYRESGYRMYSLGDLPKLEQILTLKFLGLSLGQIGDVLLHGPSDLGHMLDLQRQIVEEHIRHLTVVARALEDAGESLRKSMNIDWKDFVHIIRVVKMKNSQEWVEKFYTPEQLDKIQSGYTQEQIEESQKQWNDLIEEVRANLGKDPASPDVQPLVDRWQALIKGFTRGDAGIAGSLNNLYAHIDSAPAEFREYHNRNKEVYAFMEKAMASRR